jgi:hypothetical protein
MNKKYLLFFGIGAAVGYFMVDSLSTYPGFQQISSAANSLA